MGDLSSLVGLHIFLKGKLFQSRNYRCEIVKNAIRKDYTNMSPTEYSLYIEELAKRYAVTRHFAFLSAMSLARLLYGHNAMEQKENLTIQSTMDKYIKPYRVFDDNFSEIDLDNKILAYPKLAYLDITVQEFKKIIPQLDQLLKIPMYKKFWQFRGLLDVDSEQQQGSFSELYSHLAVLTREAQSKPANTFIAKPDNVSTKRKRSESPQDQSDNVSTKRKMSESPQDQSDNVSTKRKRSESPQDQSMDVDVSENSHAKRLQEL